MDFLFLLAEAPHTLLDTADIANRLVIRLPSFTRAEQP